GIPVIVTTQQEGEAAEVRALSLGASDFLSKPYKPSIIKHRLANAIRLRESMVFIQTVEHDSLTGLYSKDFFYQEATKLLRANPDQPYDMICMDIERFKLVNDLFGMAEGDKLLCFIADLLSARVREHGICGRLGADTFAMLIRRPRENYKKEYFIEGNESVNCFPLNIHLVAQYGIYQIDDISLPASTMCDRARLAIGSIKGKYEVYHAYYDDSIRERLLAEQRITDTMKSALQAGQFQAFYQPKYDLFTNQIVGAEALVRWVHPKRGVISPGEFVPLFERNGFITDLDFCIWEQTCRHLRELLDAGQTPPPISVNVSRVDVYNPQLPELLLALLHTYRLDPYYLHLEITESAYTQNPRQIIEMVTLLKESGFIIEMDDFGSGYSSLNMLNELPIDILKLDMHFLQSNRGENIISFIISLAKWLGLSVIAEGVETEAQASMLRNMDCNYAQGFYYAKPMPAAEFDALLRHSRIADMSHAPTLAGGIPAVTEPAVLCDCTMLLVGDTAEKRQALVHIFENSYTLAQAENGGEAVDYLLAHGRRIDVVLLDLPMPGQDGSYLMEQMRLHSFLSDIPVLVLSAAEGELCSLALGAADFIAKPYTAEVLTRRVANVMAGSKLLLQRQERELRHHLQGMQDLLHAIPGGVAILKIAPDASAIHTLYCNESYCTLFGYTEEDCAAMHAGRLPYPLSEPSSSALLGADFAAAIREGRNFTVTFKIPAVPDTWGRMTGIRSHREYGEEFYHCILADVTTEQQLCLSLQTQMERDSLTGVYNRSALVQRINSFFLETPQAPATFLMLDVDNFKHINDSMGHISGDDALCQVATALRGTLESTDVLARLGGDEFVVFFPCSLSGDTLRQRFAALRATLQIRGLSVSIGVCHAPEDGCDYAALYRSADAALLVAKQRGKNCFQCFDAIEDAPTHLPPLPKPL
ncbi:MAG: EAL domain-containing protein, partial [Oscillospiraceae bacterium]